MAEQHERESGVLGTDELCQLPDRGDRRGQAARPELAQMRGALAMLTHAGAPMAAMVVGVHRIPLGSERLDQPRVAAGVLADPVQQLHHRTGLGLRRVDVVDDRDAVCIRELGHAEQSMAWVRGLTMRPVDEASGFL